MDAPGTATALFVANRAYALRSSRLMLIQRLINAGWKVVIATARDEHSDILEAEGAIIEPLSFDRGGVSPINDVRSFVFLSKLLLKYRPHLVHHFHAKPVALGTAAAALFSKAKIVNTITGLGHAFIKGGLTYHLSKWAYRAVLRFSHAVIFLNRDDLALFVHRGWVSADRSRLIVSSGVDTSRFRPLDQPEHSEEPRILMISRLLWQKGIAEFIAAASTVKERIPNARFQLAGEWDLAHPDAVSSEAIEKAVSDGSIEFLGYVDHVEKILPSSTLLVHPSYREGVPRVLVEAAACGVPAVAFDVPGCREAIVDGVTGVLVKERSAKALAAAIATLLLNDDSRRALAGAARSIATTKFDIRAVTHRTLDVYRELGLTIQ